MSRLARAARWADNVALYDAYGNQQRPALMGQISSYIDSQQDGSISKRRVISFAPDQTLPPRRVLTYLGETWLVGDTLQDAWKGKPIRVSAATKKATGLYWIRSAAQTLAQAGGVQAYGQLIYLKDTVNTTVTSAYSPQFEVYFASSESVKAGDVIVSDDNYLLVRSVYPLLDGFVCATADEVGPAALRTVNIFTRGEYDADLDAAPDGWVPVLGLVAEFYKTYRYVNSLVPREATGDLAVFVALDTSVGDRLEFDGFAWNVLARETVSGALRLHVRRQ